MNAQKKADAALFIVTLFWGVSYVVSDYAMQELKPFQLTYARFLIAFVLSYAVFFKKMRHVSKATLKYAFIIGSFLTLVYAFTMFGMLYTNITNVGFIVALPVVICPILNMIFRGIRPEKKLAVAILLATVGMGLLTLTNGFKPALGDVLCLLSATFYSADIVITDTVINREDVDALQLGVLQIGVVGVLSAILSFIFDPAIVIENPMTWAYVVFLAIGATAVAFIVQPIAQQYTTSNHVGLIFTLEPLFSAVTAYFVMNEVMSLRGVVGAALMMLAVVFMEVDISFPGRRSVRDAKSEQVAVLTDDAIGEQERQEQ